MLGVVERLLSPIRIGSATVRNRAVVTAHGAFLEFYRPGEPPDRYLDYLARRAEGGVGLIIMQPVHVHPSSHALGHYVYDPTDLYAKLSLAARRLHDAGATVFIQLMHFGAQFTSDGRRGFEPLWGFSPITSPEGEMAHEMNDAEIDAVIDGFGRTAEIACDAGLDGVELHATHGYLLQQSFSPWANRRTDRWGEPLAFCRAVIGAVRDRIGEGKVAGIRISVDDFMKPERGGVGAPGLRAIASQLVADGKLDYVNHSEGARSAHYARAVATWRHPHVEFLPLAKELRNAIDAAVPVIGVGRITTVDEAEAALADEACDLVAMTRAHVADPDVVLKAFAGARARPCVGANQGCVDRMVGGLPITCFHNPDVGRERTVSLRAPARGRLLVAGGGPAGMRAALAAAQRGYSVRLAERWSRLGGRLLAVEGLGRKAELLGSINWLEHELVDAGVDIALNTAIGVDDLAGFDGLVVCTGSTPALADHLPATDGTVRLLTTDEAVAAPWTSVAPISGDVVVFDTLGTLEVASCVEHLSALRAKVTLVTPGPQALWACGFTHIKDLYELLGRSGVRICTSSVVAGIEQHGVSIRHVYTGTTERLAAEALVGGVPRRASDDLAAVARAQGIRVVLAGDAVAPRSAMHAFREGDDAGRTI